LTVTIAITGLIVLVIAAVFAASQRVWMKVSSQSQAYPPAYAAIKRISRDLRNAAYVICPDPAKGDTRVDWIIVYRAKPDPDRTDHANLVPVEADLNEVHAYYLSDSTGKHAATGTYLWQHVFTQNADNSVTTISRTLIAMNASELAFQPNKSLAPLDEDAPADDDAPPPVARTYTIYAMALTVEGKEKAQTSTSRFDTMITFRNPLPEPGPARPDFGTQ
jgi:hypothetical protein